MIDYAEEDIPDDLLERLQADLERISETMERIVESSRRRQGLIEGFRVAIVGKPNVGKSSLLNALLAYERAIVSDVAGTTRDTIEEEIRIGSHIIRIVDTAGIRETADRVERIGVERSLNSLEEADIVIALFDASRPWDRDDGRIRERLRNLEGKKLLVALNKTDLPQRLETEELSGFSVMRISAHGDFSELLSALQEHLDRIGLDEELMLSSARQIDAVVRCSEAIREASGPLLRGELELFSFHINEALEAVSSITRPHENEQILERMFGEFCLGK